LPQDQIMRPTALLRDDPKLARIADALREVFGSRLVSALLFGSRARGDHRADSDYDVAVFLDGYDRARDSEILRRLRESLGEDVFTLQFWPFVSDGLSERTTLMFNIRNDAVPLPGLSWPPVTAPSIAPDEGPMKPETKNLLEKSNRDLVLAKKKSLPSTSRNPPPETLISQYYPPHVRSSSNAGLQHRKPTAALRRFFPMWR
jgi:predicted nucleotidyltransferase